MNSPLRLRLGTRRSVLARWQADWVARWLVQRGVEVQLVPITTRGDVKTGPLGVLGGVGLFTKEIQRALLEGRIDLAVHSLKDLPTDEVEGLLVAAVPERAGAGDALVCRESWDLEQLPRGARVGTGSLRRKAQLLHARDDLEIAEIRGNVDTRLEKLENGQYDALVLAEAGLRRLGRQDRITQVLPKSVVLPAVGQGALGVETRRDDDATRIALAELDDPATRSAVTAERALLAELRSGCAAPVGAWGRMEGNRLLLDAAVLSGDGAHRVAAQCEGPPEEAASMGAALARQLLRRGAGPLIEAAKTGPSPSESA